MPRINYEAWEDKKLSVSRLKLDPQNLRLTQTLAVSSTKRIIAYMFEREEIMPLVKAIAIKGYFVNEMPIVFMDGSAPTVLEGNRRITACKVLLDPSLAPAAYQKTIRYYASTFDTNTLRKLRCVVAPNREAANVIIENRHTGGSQIEKWDGVQQDMWYARDLAKGYTVDELATIYAMPKSDVLTSIFRYRLYNEAKQLTGLKDSTFRFVHAADDKFPISSLWRVISNSAATKFLGLKFLPDGEVDFLLPTDEFRKRYKKIIEDLESGVINSRTMNTTIQVEAYINGLIESGSFDMNVPTQEDGASSIDAEQLEEETENNSPSNDASGNPDESSAEEDQEETSTTTPPRRNRKLNRLIGAGYVCETKSPRINKVFKELQTIPLKHVNAVSILFRTLMELVLTQYVNEKNIGDKLKDAQIQEYVTRNKKLISNLAKYLEQKYTVEPDEEEIERVLKLRAEVEARWSPSLGLMLKYFSEKPQELLPNPAMQEAFKAYVHKQLIVTPQDFNGFVHNVFYPLDAEVLVAFWDFFAPILDDIISRLESSEVDNSQDEED